MPRPIRVLFAIGALGGGGSERQVIGILKGLDRERFQPFLYLIYREGEFVKDIPEDVTSFAFWDSHSVPRFNYPGKIHRMQTKHLSEILHREDIQLLYSRTYNMGMVAYGAVHRCPVPWVTVEVADPRRALEENTDRFLRAKRRLLKKAYRRADRVLAVSEGVRRAVVETYGVPEARTKTVLNFLDLPQIDRLSEEAGPGWSSERFHLVAAGRLYPQKGIAYLLDALDALVHDHGKKELLLHLLGTGPLEAELKRIVEERRLENHVCFEGFVPNPYPMMKAAQLFCLPSLYEGMPNALLEAMACGTPVLAADCPSGPNEILRGGEFGRLVPVADAQALEAAILDCINKHDKWRALTVPASAHIEKEFAPEVGIARLEQVLLEVHSTRHSQ